jgi:hypothetical protein
MHNATQPKTASKDKYMSFKFKNKQTLVYQVLVF